MASRHRPRCATLMPNSTCALASLRASANAVPADTIAAAAMKSATRRIITVYRSLYRTLSVSPRAFSKRYATAETGIAPSFVQSLTTIYETWSPLSSIVTYTCEQVGPPRASARWHRLFFRPVAPRLLGCGHDRSRSLHRALAPAVLVVAADRRAAAGGRPSRRGCRPAAGHSLAGRSELSVGCVRARTRSHRSGRGEADRARRLEPPRISRRLDDHSRSSAGSLGARVERGVR